MLCLNLFWEFVAEGCLKLRAGFEAVLTGSADYNLRWCFLGGWFIVVVSKISAKFNWAGVWLFIIGAARLLFVVNLTSSSLKLFESWPVEYISMSTWPNSSKVVFFTLRFPVNGLARLPGFEAYYLWATPVRGLLCFSMIVLNYYCSEMEPILVSSERLYDFALWRIKSFSDFLNSFG